jgi:hypothetical protein
MPSAGDIITPPFGAWTSYTPTLTNVTVGNGTLIGDFIQFGKLVHFKIALTWGSTTSWTSPRFGLPVPAADSNWIAPAFLFDSSLNTNRQPGVCAVNSSSMVPYSGSGDVVANVPFIWAVSDVIRITGTYEAA